MGQIIEGPIELVIADDGSSDKTVDIIRSYERKDPRFNFKYLDNTSNVGITRNYQRGFAACSGKYVAVCEGDDYWSNPMKLQRQCDFLDAHWECDLCSVNYFVYEECAARFTARTAIGKGHRFISARDLILDNLVGNFSSCMYRKSALDELPHALYEIKSYDWIVNICVARHCLIGFLEEPMSVYRLHANGVWTQKSRVDKLKEQLEVISTYDELTDHVFQVDFKMLSNRLKHSIKISQIEGSVADKNQLSPQVLLNILDYMPPVFLSFSRSLVPPKLKRALARILDKGLK